MLEFYKSRSVAYKRYSHTINESGRLIHSSKGFRGDCPRRLYIVEDENEYVVCICEYYSLAPLLTHLRALHSFTNLDAAIMCMVMHNNQT